MSRFAEGRLVVARGDVTEFRGTPPCAVVNAANRSLLGGGGVDGAIHRRGGPRILEQCRAIRRTRYPQGLPTGAAVITDGGRLPADYVIHTVGPVWHGGDRGEPGLLRAAYRNSLLLAAEHEVAEVAFPAISTGVFGYPPALAARAAHGAITEFLGAHRTPQRVHLIFFSEADERAYLAAVETP